MAASICEKMKTQPLGQCLHLNYKGGDHLFNYKFLDKADPIGQTFFDMLKGE